MENVPHQSVVFDYSCEHFIQFYHFHTKKIYLNDNAKRAHLKKYKKHLRLQCVLISITAVNCTMMPASDINNNFAKFVTIVTFDLIAGTEKSDKRNELAYGLAKGTDYGIRCQVFA